MHLLFTGGVKWSIETHWSLAIVCTSLKGDQQQHEGQPEGGQGRTRKSGACAARFRHRSIRIKVMSATQDFTKTTKCRQQAKITAPKIRPLLLQQPFIYCQDRTAKLSSRK